MTYDEIKKTKISEILLQGDEALLEEVKNHLSITWDDENKEITKLVNEAKYYINTKIGIEINYTEDLLGRRLLKEYCRYVRNYSKEYFEQNFIDDIVFLQLKYASEDLENGESKS